MLEMKDFLCSALQEIYGNVCLFEHGPSRENLKLGCGVDHAHLHLVPIQFDISTAVSPFLPKDIIWSNAGLSQCQATFAQGEDYLYFEQPIGSGHIAVNQNLGSQLFRRAIASRVDTFSQFNWKEYPQLPNVSATINKVRAWKKNAHSGMPRSKMAA